MFSGAITRATMWLLALGAAAAPWGVWAWRRRVRRRERERSTRGQPAVPPVEGHEGPVTASCLVDEPCQGSRRGWSLDLSDDP
jgi:hypothetical protein